MKSRKSSWIRAVVHAVRDGPHGPFAIATTDGIEGSVTFSLKPPVWKERTRPERGVHVLLKDIQFKRAGWRAERGRFLRPSDVKQ